MVHLAKRNVLIFFRDKSAVFFSFLSVLIILGLYVIFLGDLIADGLPDVAGVPFLIDSWVMAGIVAVASFTSTLGAYGIMIEDRHRNIVKDFTTSPMRRGAIAGGYVLSAFATGVIISAAALLFAEICIVLRGGTWLPVGSFMQALSLILLAVLASSAMAFFIASLTRSHSAFASISTIAGTLIGFLTGIYIPIGSLPAAVQFFIKIFPVSHAAALFRTIMLERPMETSFAGAPADMAEQFRLNMGVVYQFGDYTVHPAASVAALLATSALFYAIAVANMSRKAK